MANSKLGTKRVDPETGQKFYDLNRDRIVSPYTGKSYPLSYSYFTASSAREEEEEVETEELDVALEKPEFVALEEADARRRRTSRISGMTTSKSRTPMTMTRSLQPTKKMRMTMSPIFLAVVSATTTRIDFDLSLFTENIR